MKFPLLLGLLFTPLLASLSAQQVRNFPMNTAEEAVENDGGIQSGAFEPELGSLTGDGLGNDRLSGQRAEGDDWSLESAGEASIEQAAEENAETRFGLMHHYSKAAAIQEFERRMRKAEVATVTRDFELAERIYMSILKELPLDQEQRREAMMDLAELCKAHRRYGKIVVVYEKFLEEYPRDPTVAAVSMDLGLIYRGMGAFESALRKFYSVLNLSLLLPKEQIETYRVLSTRAQIEIAETHYLMGDYDQAARFYDRLLRLELSPEERASVTFRKGYTHFLMEDFKSSISVLRDYGDMFPGDSKVPESHYLLAESYRQLNQMQAAMQEVITLLRTNEVVGEQNPALWLFWKQKTGNQLANAFYERGDFLNALKIYQAMTPLSASVVWQAPIIYQIGLCFERLRMAPKAVEAYAMLESLDQWSEEVTALNELPQDLVFVREMAVWRKEHLEWSLNKENRLNDILNRPLLKQDDSTASLLPRTSSTNSALAQN